MVIGSIPGITSDVLLPELGLKGKRVEVIASSGEAVHISLQLHRIGGRSFGSGLYVSRKNNCNGSHNVI